MAIMEPLIGKWVKLRCANESDAQFTLDIRNDKKLNSFIPAINGTVEKQTDWIENQKKVKFDLFCVIESVGGERKGTISCYDFNQEKKACELGRFISYGNALENVEAAILLLDHVFKSGVDTVVLNIDENNRKVVNFWHRFGAEFDEKIQMNNWISERYLLYYKIYSKYRSKIVALLLRE